MPVDLRQLGTPIETKDGAQSKADAAEDSARNHTDSEVTDHENSTSGVHGVGGSDVASTADVAEKADDPHDNAAHSETFAVDGDTQPPENHGNAAHTTNYTDTSPSDVNSSNWGDFEIQKNGTDGNGIINFKT